MLGLPQGGVLRALICVAALGRLLAMFRIALLIRLAVLLSVGCSGAVGCAQHRVPAIDPTGRHIFSGTTTLASHDWGHLFHHRQPAATAPVGPLAVAPAIVAPVS